MQIVRGLPGYDSICADGRSPVSRSVSRCKARWRQSSSASRTAPPGPSITNGIHFSNPTKFLCNQLCTRHNNVLVNTTTISLTIPRPLFIRQ